MNDYAELRRLAERATPRDDRTFCWDSEMHLKGKPREDGTYETYGTYPLTEEVCEVLDLRDRRYIAAANPQAILNLLDDLDACRAAYVDARTERDMAEAHRQTLIGLLRLVTKIGVSCVSPATVGSATSHDASDLIETDCGVCVVCTLLDRIDAEIGTEGAT